MEERYEFDEVTRLCALAVGTPGKRTFFLTVEGKDDWVRVWLEKQELQALGLAAHQFLLSSSQAYPGKLRDLEASTIPAQTASGLPRAELEVEEITLSSEGGNAAMEIIAHRMGPTANSAKLRCNITLAQLQSFASEALTVCAAGRPRCPLCGGPIETAGHVCPRSN